ncbi:amino acid/amide ABC transporter ATP-binding protein 2, HAAT family [Rhizobiales bacterium GAS191]|nr:amino acid/amide ABC transporter ATP-binding protein 2, HAAT family [Rhizobiales bacterium GAS191]SEE49974.1 amino acid/amide ABC transporter ATP-binding protein 2, HAAT family [Rhizobiales bacterium GAS188]
MLELRDLAAGYGSSQVLFGVDLKVAAGEVVTLIGRNGMGKTTTVGSIMGMVGVRGGSISFMGRDLRGMPSHRIARCGLGLVPEGRRIFPNLTVRENLLAMAADRDGAASPWTFERVMELFPALTTRLTNWGNQLSGGEQQMLAIGRALMTNPKLLILDEATEGLAPLIRAEIWRCLEHLKGLGQAILVIDKNLDQLMRIADRHNVLEKGRIVWRGDSAALRADDTIRRRYLGV